MVTLRDLGLVLGIATLGGCLSPEEYPLKYEEKYCEEWAECNAGPCSIPTASAVQIPDGCDFDRGEARDCLKADWACNDEFPGFEYPTPAEACSRVSACPATATPTDAT